MREQDWHMCDVLVAFLIGEFLLGCLFLNFGAAYEGIPDLKDGVENDSDWR